TLTASTPVSVSCEPLSSGSRHGVATLNPPFLVSRPAVSGFCYAGSVLPIWRMAQPIVYVALWISATAIVLGLVGAALVTFVKPEVAQFVIPAFKGWNPQIGPYGIMPLWPMLFVTIACGAISG